MFELLVSGAAVVAMVRIASADDQSPLLWGLIMFGLCVLSFVLLPGLPFIRVGIAFVAAFVGMIAYKVIKDR